MRQATFARAIQKTPVIVPVFRLIKPFRGYRNEGPKGGVSYDYPLKAGSEVYVDRFGSTTAIKTGVKYGFELKPSYLEFVEYRDVNLNSDNY